MVNRQLLVTNKNALFLLQTLMQQIFALAKMSSSMNLSYSSTVEAELTMITPPVFCSLYLNHCHVAFHSSFNSLFLLSIPCFSLLFFLLFQSFLKNYPTVHAATNVFHEWLVLEYIDVKETEM
mgnify:CR=1 FL=1